MKTATQGVSLRCMSADGSEAIIDVVGVIGWQVEYQRLRDLIRAIPEPCRKVTFDIYSPGGDVWEGNGIVQEIGELGKRCETVARVQIAASMATLIAVACGSRSIAANGRFLIHNAWSAVTGDASEMEKMAKTLRDCEEEAARFYAARTGQSCEAIRALMGEERWMMPEEAQQLGFVQTISDPFKIEEYAAVREAIVAAGKWPKALADITIAPVVPAEVAKEAKQNEHPADAGAANTTATATMCPAAAADATAYKKTEAAQASAAAEAVVMAAEYAEAIRKRDALVRAMQGDKDKALAALAAEQKRREAAEVKAADELIALRSALAVEQEKLLAALKGEHAKAVADAQAAADKMRQANEQTIKDLTVKLADMTERHRKMLAGGLTFDPAPIVSTWPEAMRACNGVYEEAARRYPELKKQYQEQHRRK